MTDDTPSNVIPFPVEQIPDDPTEGHEGETPGTSMVILPYLTPFERAWHALGKQAQVAFVTTALLGAGDLVARLTTGEMLLDGKMIALAVAALVIHAALVAVNKYSAAQAEDEASQ